MFHKAHMRIKTVAVTTVLSIAALTMPTSVSDGDHDLVPSSFTTITADAAGMLSINDMPAEYRYAADWIWENRIVAERSTEGSATIFDQIIAGKGTINYVVKWQSYKPITLERRKQFEAMLSECINDWAGWLAGYENWPYDHIDVKIVGWAVLDENCLLDRQPDEIVYTNLTDYDSSGDTSNGYEEIPNKTPNAPNEISRLYHYEHRNDPGFDAYNYPGGLDKRFDMYMWAIQGFPAIGGCGGAWGQTLSDDAYINIVESGFGKHVLEHEMGHGFGWTDFYGEEGEPGGFPPGGFPSQNKNSIMMAGSSQEITDFDGWMLRYMWTKIKDQQGRFDFSQITEPPTEPYHISFTDTITDVGDGYITFNENGTYYFSGDFYGGDEQKNFAHYETGDKITVNFSYDPNSSVIFYIEQLTLIENIRDNKITGDINADGEFSIADVILLQKWLLAVPDTTLANWKAGDLYEDNVLNVFDLCLMKRKLINK